MNDDLLARIARVLKREKVRPFHQSEVSRLIRAMEDGTLAPLLDKNIGNISEQVENEASHARANFRWSQVLRAAAESESNLLAPVIARHTRDEIGAQRTESLDLRDAPITVLLVCVMALREIPCGWRNEEHVVKLLSERLELLRKESAPLLALAGAQSLLEKVPPYRLEEAGLLPGGFRKEFFESLVHVCLSVARNSPHLSLFTNSRELFVSRVAEIVRLKLTREDASRVIRLLQKKLSVDSFADHDLVD